MFTHKKAITLIAFIAIWAFIMGYAAPLLISAASTPAVLAGSLLLAVLWYATVYYLWGLFFTQPTEVTTDETAQNGPTLEPGGSDDNGVSQ